MVDLGELLESGSGKIVLEPDAVLGKNGEPSDEERERALREEHIANALDYHPAFKRAAVEAESGSKSSGKAAK